MTAQSIDVSVLSFSDPALNESKPEKTKVDADISFQITDSSHVRTLSLHGASGDTDIRGLLYVPELDPSNPCVNGSAPYVPDVVTRKADLPSSGSSYIAFAPWFSAACTKSYLAAANGATAFLTFIPDNSTVTPPQLNDQVWNLNDGGRWKSENDFPAFALPGAEGSSIMQQLGVFSGNSSSSTKIREILASENLDSRDYVRLYTTIGMSSSSHLPNLWQFLLIVLGIVVLFIVLTLFLARYVQRRRRRDLQRRVENGELDLEALGITQTRLPTEAINAFPTSIYAPIKPEATGAKGLEESTFNTSSSPPDKHPQWLQPTCPICLEDFIPNVTTVRSLPCQHFYHPNCIDRFLRDNRAICPVCKARVVPLSGGYVITNAMVRRERRLRRAQEDIEQTEPSVHGDRSDSGENRSWILSFRRWNRATWRHSSPPDDPIILVPRLSDESELSSVETLPPPPVSHPPSRGVVGVHDSTAPPDDSSSARRKWPDQQFRILDGLKRPYEDRPIRVFSLD